MGWSHGVRPPRVDELNRAGLWALNHPCIPGTNPTWLWRVTLLVHHCAQFASISLRISASVFIRDVGPEFSCGSLSAFGVGVTLAS